MALGALESLSFFLKVFEKKTDVSLKVTSIVKIEKYFVEMGLLTFWRHKNWKNNRVLSKNESIDDLFESLKVIERK